MIHMDFRDLSYIRRLRVTQTMKLVCYVLEMDLKDATREDINNVMIYAHGVCHTPSGKETFIKMLKYIWKVLFPELDEKGRADETLTPYAVRHLSTKIDKSRQKMRKDKLSWEELRKIIDYFNSDPRMQAYLSLAIESLSRPQELLYVKIKNVELYDNYAKLWITEHGKEGTGLLQCIDSYPELIRWLDKHPQRNNPDAFLFINTGGSTKLCQLRPTNINKLLRHAVKDLKIDKPVTCYSLKRNGVTLRRLRGDSDMEIQHAARWTSTKQLKTYDLSTQEDALKQELIKRGYLSDADKNANKVPKICLFCNTRATQTDIVCQNCKRPLDRGKILQEERQKEQELAELRERVLELDNLIGSVGSKVGMVIEKAMTQHTKDHEKQESHAGQQEHH